MEIFDRKNIDELLEICQIRQYFPHQKFCGIFITVQQLSNGSYLYDAYSQ